MPIFATTPTIQAGNLEAKLTSKISFPSPTRTIHLWKCWTANCMPQYLKAVPCPPYINNHNTPYVNTHKYVHTHTHTHTHTHKTCSIETSQHHYTHAFLPMSTHTMPLRLCCFFSFTYIPEYSFMMCVICLFLFSCS